MPDLSRRGMLRAAATAGVGAVALPGLAGAGELPVARGATIKAAEGVAPGWAELTGRVVRPSDRTYAAASQGWDELFVHYPLVIVFAQETRDVVNALTWARQNDVALRVRSGRHCLEGWSNVDNGIVIDVSEMKSVQIDTATGLVTLGAGLSQLEAVQTLAKKNLAVTTGGEGTVGLAGATLGGGFGLLNRYLGMACDSLISAEVVIAGGTSTAQVVTADLQNNSDLLWALRGAGNGNFGIVTSLTYQATQLQRVAYLQATWDGLADMARIFDAWQRTTPFATDRLGSQLEVHKNQILLFGTMAEGWPSGLKQALAPVLSIGKPKIASQVGNWGDIYASFQIPTKLDPANWKFFSQFTSQPFPQKALGVVASFMREAPTDDSNFFAQAFGGAVKNAPAGGTAFPHRDALFYSEPGAGWGTRGKPGSGAALTSQAQAWIAEFSQALRPYVNGAYVNVPNVGMLDWGTAYWGSNFSRLRAIKAKYDSGNFFQYEQSIPPA
jgi:hypothetical protein